MESAIKILNVDDLGVSIAKLSRGTYLIDGETVKIESYSTQDIQIKSTVICPINVTNLVTHYENGEGDKLSADEYAAKKSGLQSKGTDDEDDGYSFKDLDDEYAYKRFTRDYIAIFRSVTTIGDPLPIECTPIVSDTGNKHIKPLFSAKDLKKLYTYDRSSATMVLTTKCFKSLGMEYNAECSYGKTKNEKIWGNSTHSHLEYVTAFGRYLWTKTKQPRSGKYTGTLDQMKGLYDHDKEYINTAIKSGYQAHFSDASIVTEKLLVSMKSILNQVSEIQSKQKTAGTKRHAVSRLNELIADIESELAANA